MSKDEKIQATVKQKPSEALQGLAGRLKQYAAFIFFLLLACVYGFVLLRINMLSNVPASQSTDKTPSATTPHIDQAVVDQLKNLKDNSVNVKTLFDKARTNPFQE